MFRALDPRQPHKSLTNPKHRPHQNINCTKTSTRTKTSIAPKHTVPKYRPHQNTDSTKTLTVPKYQLHQNIDCAKISTPKHRPHQNINRTNTLTATLFPHSMILLLNGIISLMDLCYDGFVYNYFVCIISIYNFICYVIPHV